MTSFSTDIIIVGLFFGISIISTIVVAIWIKNLDKKPEDKKS